ncbi:putative coupling of ubiquitin conjugation to ER degradation protein [Cercophora samala]|uniref:Coupling of ubiquitin conjugation to ER degradation protein 1 n=1 Tax=Cercophora samala TaxID=330535 RepID=A0AA39ZJM7_9PEZI|nr:putative coupling of ubiquitin conjugation to ER degradation protein [Cercophora samala]
MADEIQQVNVPGLVVILILSGILLRYFFSGSGGNGNGNGSGNGARRRAGGQDPAAMARQREAAVQRVQQMFPHLGRREVLWDLQRTGGNVALTTERILGGRLETPPATFQPPPPPEGSAAPVASGNANGNSIAKPPVPAHPDLITRYNLAEKLKASGDAEEEAKGGGNGKKAWSSNKDERQTLLQKRRDQMILEARRKMEAKLAAEKAAKGL